MNSEICGGSAMNSFQMAGGVVVNYDGYSVYVGNDGSQYVFDGVNVSGCIVCASDVAYQFNGQIKVEVLREVVLV